MNFDSVDYTQSFIRVYNSLHKFVSKVFKDPRIKSYRITKVSEFESFESKHIQIEVKYSSSSGKHTMVLLMTPQEIVREYEHDSKISIYKNQLKY